MYDIRFSNLKNNLKLMNKKSKTTNHHFFITKSIQE
jgi:hypothetical protein